MTLTSLQTPTDCAVLDAVHFRIQGRKQQSG